MKVSLMLACTLLLLAAVPSFNRWRRGCLAAQELVAFRAKSRPTVASDEAGALRSYCAVVSYSQPV